MVPILLYQGARPWSAARRLSDLHRLPGAPRSELPAFIDLHMIIHELRSDPLPQHELTTLVRAALGLMKLIAAGELDPSNAALVARWFVEVRRAHGLYAFTALVSYFFHADPNERMIDAIAKELPTTMRSSMMSIAQKLEARGHERGKVEGRLEGQREGQAALVVRMLRLRFGALPLRVTRRVRGGMLLELERWSERLLTAATLDEVFAADD